MIASGILAPANGSSSVTTPSGITTPKCTIDAIARVTASTSIKPAITLEIEPGCLVMYRRSYLRARYLSSSPGGIFQLPPELTRTYYRGAITGSPMACAALLIRGS